MTRPLSSRLSGWVSRALVFRALLAIALLVPAAASFAQNNYAESNNYKKAEAALYAESYAEAYEYLQKEIAVHPDNGYAYCLIAIINYQFGQYHNSVDAAAEALCYLARPDKTARAKAYYVRALSYEALGLGDNALEDYSNAIELCPKDTEYLLARGEFYYSAGRYDESDTDYRRVLALDSENPTAQLGLGRNKVGRGLYNEAVRHFTAVINNYPDVSEPYAYRAEAYLLNYNTSAAINDIVRALDIDGNKKAFTLLLQCAKSSHNEVSAAIDSKIRSGRQLGKWLYCRGVVYYDAGKYDDAITSLRQAYETSENAAVAALISDCYLAKLDFDESLSYIGKAIESDTLNPSYKDKKAVICWFAGELNDAIDAETDAIRDRESYYYYYRRGWYRELSGDFDGALEDYTQSINHYPYYPYSLMSRGRVYIKNGYTLKGREDLERCIELDDQAGEGNCAQYAYLYLGDYQKAKDFMQGILSHSGSAGNLYDAACLYSLLNEIDASARYLDESLSAGFNNYSHIQNDPDLANLRADARFGDLMRRYFHTPESNDTGADLIDPDGEASDPDVDVVQNVSRAYEAFSGDVYYEIPFTSAYGIRKVSGRMNGMNITLNYLDAATGVRISAFEVSYLLKNGFIRRSDITYRGENVSTSAVPVGSVILIGSLSVGDFSRENVEAVVVSNDNPAITFGRAFLKGTVTLGRDSIKVKTKKNQ